MWAWWRFCPLWAGGCAFISPNVSKVDYYEVMESNQPTTKRIATLALILSLVIMGNAARPTRIETGVTSEETA